MKVILINGSPHEKGCTNRGLEEIAATLKKQGIEAKILWLGLEPISGCRGCGACGKLGRCVIQDQVNPLAEEILSADGLVFGSPVHYAAASGAITCFMDRLFYAYGRRLAGKPACAIVSCRRGGASAAFDQLNKYFSISSMPIVTGQYWNMIHGSKAEDVEKDEEGLQTMRSLANQMAYLLRSICTASENQILPPEREAQIRTNFIR